MHAAVLYVEIHIGESRSLKDKRSVVRHILDTARHHFRVSAAEVDHQDLRQLAGLGFASVASQAGQASDVLDSVERFVWSHPEVEVSETRLHWLDAQN